MQKQVSYKIVSLVFGILVLSFVVGFYIFAWTEPQLTPPQGNVDRPINVGGTGQIKSGALTIGGGFESRGVTLLATFGGNVGIGTTTPTKKLEVNGTIGFTGGQGPFCIFANVCPNGWVNKGYAGYIICLNPIACKLPPGEVASTCPYRGGSAYGSGWNWCHPKICCNQ